MKTGLSFIVVRTFHAATFEGQMGYKVRVRR